MSRRLILIAVPLALGAVIGAAVLFRQGRAPGKETPRGKRIAAKPVDLGKPQARVQAPEPPPAALKPEKPATKEAQVQAGEDLQVRMLVQRLRESALRGDRGTQEAMILGLKNWKRSRAVLEDEIARTGGGAGTEALQEALRALP